MYNAQITRRCKGAFILLIDRSGSMDETVTFNGRECTKAQAVAETANMLIDEIINRSHRDDGVYDYFDIAAAGYAADKVEQLWGGGFKRVSQLFQMPVPTEKILVRRSTPTGKNIDMILQRRCWIEPAAKGNTPMLAALVQARKLAAKWCRQNPESFPPIVINITDGEPSDADETMIAEAAEALKATATQDGNTLLVNIHTATRYDTPQQSLKFPAEGDKLPENRHTRMLYAASSTLPSLYDKAIEEIKGCKGEGPYKAMCYNCSADELVGLLNIGSASMDQLL